MANFDLKIVLLGAQSTGKSCLLQTYVAREWRATLRPTYGAAFAARRYELASGHSVSIGAWDTSGSPAFQNVSKRFIHGADGAVVVCDVTSRPSWEKLKIWVHTARQEQPGILIFVVCSKMDLVTGFGPSPPTPESEAATAEVGAGEPKETPDSSSDSPDAAESSGLEAAAGARSVRFHSSTQAGPFDNGASAAASVAAAAATATATATAAPPATATAAPPATATAGEDGQHAGTSSSSAAPNSTCPPALDYVEVENYCKTSNASLFLVSAKTGQGVTELFHGIVMAGAAAHRIPSLQDAVESRPLSIRGMQSMTLMPGGHVGDMTMSDASAEVPKLELAAGPAPVVGKVDLRGVGAGREASFANSPWHAEYVFDEDGLIAQQPQAEVPAQAARKKQSCRVT